MKNELVLELPTDIRSIEPAVQYVVDHCPNCPTNSGKVNLNFRVGLTEALANAMLYGNGHDPDKCVTVEVCLTETRIEACVTDQGEGFNPGAVPDPTSDENLAKGGGRGLYLMRRLLDEVCYNERGNQVKLVLNFDSDVPLEGGAQA